MRERGAARLVLLMFALFFLHYTLRPMLDWKASVDFALVLAMLAAIWVRPGFAAAIGFIVGLLVDAQHPGIIGASALAMACVAFATSALRSGFFAERFVLNTFLFFAGKLMYDLLVALMRGISLDGFAFLQMALWSLLAAALTAIVGVVALGFTRPVYDRHRN